MLFYTPKPIPLSLCPHSYPYLYSHAYSPVPIPSIPLSIPRSLSLSISPSLPLPIPHDYPHPYFYLRPHAYTPIPIPIYSVSQKSLPESKFGYLHWVPAKWTNFFSGSREKFQVFIHKDWNNNTAKKYHFLTSIQSSSVSHFSKKHHAALEKTDVLPNLYSGKEYIRFHTTPRKGEKVA
jgi:hypothetical protein